MTWSPTLRLEELAMPSGTTGLFNFSTIFKTAKSPSVSFPTMEAVYLLSSTINVTSTDLALLITW